MLVHVSCLNSGACGHCVAGYLCPGSYCTGYWSRQSYISVNMSYWDICTSMVLHPNPDDFFSAMYRVILLYLHTSKPLYLDAALLLLSPHPSSRSYGLDYAAIAAAFQHHI
jgi:hypothetical protein